MSYPNAENFLEPLHGIRGGRAQRRAGRWGEYRFMQTACGLAFDYGRALGNLELRQVMLDKEMSEDPDERVRRLAEENLWYRKENDELHLMLNRHGFSKVYRCEPGSARLLQGLDPDDWVERLYSDVFLP